MESITPASVVLLSRFASPLAQDTKASPVTTSLISASAATVTTRASPKLEEECAECFQDCYGEYGSFPNCSLGKDKFFECWCGEDDWEEKEEDCMWDIQTPWLVDGNVIYNGCDPFP